MVLALLLAALAAVPATAQQSVALLNQYQITPNVTYLVANNHENKLDVYRRRDTSAPMPTLVYIHGGGWVAGSKEGALLNILPYMEWGFNVVNVGYRLGRVSLGPAAVEDCRCALRWVIRNAKQYGFDTSRIVLTGHSAGGHLSLITGMLEPSAGLDRICPGTEDLKAAAIVNWFGITDVVDLLDGPNQKTYAVMWLGSLPDRAQIGKRVSPLSYVRPGLPPILTIHGDADPTVPYQHGTRLHDALRAASSPNHLLTIPGGKHGGFSNEEHRKIYSTIREFLTRHKLIEP